MGMKRAVRNSYSWFQSFYRFEPNRSVLYLFFILLVFPSQLNALYCYRCLSLECPGTLNECDNVKNFVLEHVKSYYHMDKEMPLCPPLNDTFNWRLAQLDVEACPKQEVPACAAGHIGIRTYNSNAKVEGESTPPQPSFISQATIMGCANLDLLNALKTARIGSKCDNYKKEGNNVNGLKHKLEMEHCNGIDYVCHHDDFCLSQEQSVVKPYNYDVFSNGKSYGLVIGIFVFVLIVVAGIAGANFCSFPTSRSYILPKKNSLIEEPDLVTVVPVQNTESNQTTQIERTQKDETIKQSD